MICDFCMTNYEADKVDKHAKSYTCSRCVQLLYGLSQDRLRNLYELAIKHNKKEKVRAIRSFYRPEYKLHKKG